VDSSGELKDKTYEEDYEIDPLTIKVCDYIAKVTVPDFQKAWDASPEPQTIETYAFSSIKTLEDAIRELIEYFGMVPCDGSEVPKKTRHALFLSGVFVGNVKVLVRVRMRLDANGVSIEVCVRSPSEIVNTVVANAVQ